MNSPKWPSDKMLSFPKGLLVELLDECPNYDKDFYAYFNTWKLKSDSPVFVSNLKLLKNNQDVFAGEPQYINDLVNEKWGMTFKSKKVTDKDPDRSIRYAKLSPKTAPPSVLVNGSLAFGNGRWIASLLRKDEGIFVWDIETI